MDILFPEVINDSVLVNSSIPENDAEIWCAFDGYLKGQQVISKKDNSIYEALVDIPIEGFNLENISIGTSSAVEIVAVENTKSNQIIVVYRASDGNVYTVPVTRTKESFYSGVPTLLFATGFTVYKGTLNAFYDSTFDHIIVVDLEAITFKPHKCVFSVGGSGTVTIKSSGVFLSGLFPSSQNEFLRSVYIEKWGAIMLLTSYQTNYVLLTVEYINYDGSDVDWCGTNFLATNTKQFEMCYNVKTNDFYVMYYSASNMYIRKIKMLQNGTFVLGTPLLLSGFAYAKMSMCYSLADNVVNIVFTNTSPSALYLKSIDSDCTQTLHTTVISGTASDTQKIVAFYSGGKTIVAYRLSTGNTPAYYKEIENTHLPPTIATVTEVAFNGSGSEKVGDFFALVSDSIGKVFVLYMSAEASPVFRLQSSIKTMPDLLTEDYLALPLWAYVDPTNRYAMFDGHTATSSKAYGGFDFSIAQLNPVDCITFFGLNGSLLEIDVRNNTGDIVKSYSYNLTGKRSITAYIDVAVTNAVYDVTYTGNGLLKMSDCQIGRIHYAGDAQQGTSVSYDDYSVVEQMFGRTRIKKLGNSRVLTVKLFIPQDSVESVDNLLRDLISTPASFIPTADDKFKFLTTAGFYQTYTITTDLHGSATIEVREVS